MLDEVVEVIEVLLDELLVVEAVVEAVVEEMLVLVDVVVDRAKVGIVVIVVFEEVVVTDVGAALVVTVLLPVLQVLPIPHVQSSSLGSVEFEYE